MTEDEERQRPVEIRNARAVAVGDSRNAAEIEKIVFSSQRIRPASCSRPYWAVNVTSCSFTRTLYVWPDVKSLPRLMFSSYMP